MYSCVYSLFVGRGEGEKKVTEWPFYFFNRAENHAEYKR